MAGLSTVGKAVAILGAGTQGRRLAYMWSSQGNPVTLLDLQTKQLNESLPYIETLRASAGKGVSHKWGNINPIPANDLKSALSDAWLILECVPEKLPIKRSILTKIDEAAPSDAIIASNSSSFGITEIIEGLKLNNLGNALSAHCYWPPETPAIELMASPHTNPDLIPFMMTQCAAHGFSPFHVKRDSTGYIYNRIWAAIKREALMVVEEGVATPEEVDAIFKDVLKTPKGPCEQMDVVGLDVVLDIEEHYAERRGNLPEEPRRLLRSMIEEKRLGVKNGRGFYDYSK